MFEPPKRALNEDYRPLLYLNRFWGSGGPRQGHDMKTKQRWILLTFIICAFFVVLILLSVGSLRRDGSYPLSLTINLDELTERGKCPACFGVNVCPAMLTGKITLNDWTKYSVSRLANKKNVYYATWMEGKSERNVVLKKLAHDHELDQLDKTICDRQKNTDSCDVSDAVRVLIDEYSHHSKLRPDEPILHGEKIGAGTDVLLCPSHSKMEFLIDAANKFNKGQHPKTILANVLTMLLLNPEPLILMAFTARQGWPFPTYYGSCGRIAVEEYVGRRLTTYYHEPFKVRAFIARQLLQMANKFGENPTDFALYMTDVSPDNFAVDENTHMVKMIDLENIMIVDKEVLITSKVHDANKLLVGSSTFCDKEGNDENECFAFSPEDLCTRPLTDHNYYAICAGLLAPGALATQFPDGLLHSVPDIPQQAQIELLLQQCKNPRMGPLKLTRVEAAQSLLDVLINYLGQ